LRERAIMPLICPTCQNVFARREASMPASPGYFAWGCFRYFGFLGVAFLVASPSSLSLRSSYAGHHASPFGPAWLRHA
jgi:hypothetical protein